MPTYWSFKVGGAGFLLVLAAQVGLAGPVDLHALKLAKLEKTSILLSYRTHTCMGEPKEEDTAGFTYQDTMHRTNRATSLGAGSLLFAKAPAKGRFFFKEFRYDRVLNPRIGVMQPQYTAVIEDRRPNKRGTVYLVGRGGRGGFVIHDYTATLSLRSPGQKERLLQIEENGSFRLPFGNKDPKARVYTFRMVDPGARPVVEYRVNGELRQWELPVPAE